MTKEDYWIECVANAAEESGAVLTKEQVNYIADAAKCAEENMGMAFGYPESSPYPAQIKALESELRKERAKIKCDACDGEGSITTHGPCHSAWSKCWKCNGDGRVSR